MAMMNRVFLLCIFACFIILETTNAVTTINPGAINAAGAPSKLPQPSNTYHRPCLKSQRCNDGTPRRKAEEKVDKEDKEQMLEVENTAAFTSPPQLDDVIEQDVVVLGH
ncbi:hypothetical protein FRX31_012448 [Thalictrum thalictroides]|uniref:Uncharacterized protein n=1 Tax=Thalictrum thalictroides TaxID=46969 RepID=A0A7J6WKT0_THATH|nr:hypothetical protein FRX31_012448 [Thalictrum thalictroides]